MLKIYLEFLEKHLGLFLLLIMLFVALFTFDEYGMSWDEQTQRKTGLINYNYVFSDDNSLLTWADKDYGVAFELPLVIIEKTLRLKDSRHIYIMRHLVTHCFFLIACYFLFLLIDHMYRNKLLATIGFLFLLLHPRIYAHSFFNTKDIPFLSMFIICFYYYVKAFDKKSISNFLILGLVVGLLINLRIMGIIIFVGTPIILILDRIRGQKKQLKLVVVFALFAFLSLYITWPYLWNNPIDNFLQAFENMSKFRWDYHVLFKGEFIRATKIDWTYIPTWFSITTPLTYLVLGCFGTLLLIIQFVKQPSAFLDNSLKRNNLLFLGYFLAPLFAVIILHSVLYDGWRQMFFIYPPFILVGIYGLSYLIKKNRHTYNASLAFVIIALVLTATNMAQNFPFQNVYFNEVYTFNQAEEVRKKFEMDYWGVSYKQSLEYILKIDPARSINVAVANQPGETNLAILSAHNRNRINLVEPENASYFITNFRWHPQIYEEYEKHKFHSFKAYNNTVSEIYKLK